MKNGELSSTKRKIPKMTKQGGCLPPSASILSVNRLLSKRRSLLFLKLAWKQEGENTRGHCMMAQGDPQRSSNSKVKNEGTELEVCSGQFGTLLHLRRIQDIVEANR